MAGESPGVGHGSQAGLHRCADAAAGFFLSARHGVTVSLTVCVTPYVPEIVTVVVLDTVCNRPARCRSLYDSFAVSAAQFRTHRTNRPNSFRHVLQYLNVATSERMKTGSQLRSRSLARYRLASLKVADYSIRRQQVARLTYDTNHWDRRLGSVLLR